MIDLGCADLDATVPPVGMFMALQGVRRPLIRRQRPVSRRSREDRLDLLSQRGLAALGPQK